VVGSLQRYDWILLLIIGLGAWNGYRTGAVAQILRFCGILVSYWLALHEHTLLVPLIEQFLQGTTFAKSQPPIMVSIASQGISLMVTFLLASFLFGVLSSILQGIFMLPVLSWINRSLGLVVGAGMTILLITVLIQVSTFVRIPFVQHVVANSVIAKELDQAFWGFFHKINPVNQNPFHIS
jgi:uncharacterized membrane protein required for colicin V production